MFFLKKRGSRKKKKRNKSPFDRHHIFWIRSEWSKGNFNKLRLHPYCIVPMHRETIHRYIHNHLAFIPLPKSCSVEYALYQLETLEQYGVISQDDSVERRLSILIALFECADQPTADALKEQLKLIHEFKKAPQ